MRITGYQYRVSSLGTYRGLLYNDDLNQHHWCNHAVASTAALICALLPTDPNDTVHVLGRSFSLAFLHGSGADRPTPRFFVACCECHPKGRFSLAFLAVLTHALCKADVSTYDARGRYPSVSFCSFSIYTSRIGS